MPKILFDESHAQLLNSQAIQGDSESDRWETLHALLKAQGWEISVWREEQGQLTAESLAGYDLLVLAAPSKPLLPGEIKVVQDFVADGHALLVANNAESLWRQNSRTMAH